MSNPYPVAYRDGAAGSGAKRSTAKELRAAQERAHVLRNMEVPGLLHLFHDALRSETIDLGREAEIERRIEHGEAMDGPPLYPTRPYKPKPFPFEPEPTAGDWIKEQLEHPTRSDGNQLGEPWGNPFGDHPHQLNKSLIGDAKWQFDDPSNNIPLKDIFGLPDDYALAFQGALALAPIALGKSLQKAGHPLAKAIGHAIPWIWPATVTEEEGAGEPVFPPGWSKTCETGGSPTHWRYNDNANTTPIVNAFHTSTYEGVSVCDVGTRCLTRSITKPDLSGATVVGGYVDNGTVHTTHTNDDTFLGRAVVNWQYTGPEPYADPYYAPDTSTRLLVAPRPVVMPAVDPMKMPISQPADVRAVPYPELPQLPDNPWRSGYGEGNHPMPPQVKTITLPRARVLPGFIVRPAPGPVPAAPPVVEVSPQPGRPIERPPTPPQGRNSGGPHTKERKARYKNGLGHTLVNYATENLDLIDAMHSALPKHLRSNTGNRDYPSKMEDLWKHFDEVDLDAFVKNVINNQFEDYLYGKLGSKVGEASARAGITTGLDRAIRGAIHKDAGGEAPQLPELVETADGGYAVVTPWGEIILTR